jgi:hypothetical protein
VTKLSKQQMEAAQAFANATLSVFKLPTGRVHPPTLIAATARMAGTYLFRSFDLPLPGIQPGQPVLSDAANRQGPELIEIAAGILARLGIDIGEPPSKPDTDPAHKPMLPFLDTQQKLEAAYAPIRTEFALSEREAALAASVATALLIRHSAQALDPGVAFGIAAYGFIEGSKTAPAPMAAG